MPVTMNDVGSNPFNLFLVERNDAKDTPEGVQVKLRKHDRNHLAGSGQESLRQQWGLKIDPSAEDVVIITGHTIASLMELRKQYDESRAQASSAERQVTFNRLEVLHRAVNMLEQNLGAAPTSERDLDHRFDDAFHSTSAAQNAIAWLKRQEAWLTEAQALESQVSKIRSLFPDQNLSISELGLKAGNWDNRCDTAAWEVSFDREVMDALIANPDLAKDTWRKVSELVSELKRQLTEAGFTLEELNPCSDCSDCIIEPIDNRFGGAEMADKLFAEVFGFDRHSLHISFFHQDNDGVRAVLWKETSYRWESIDALLLFQKLTKK